jgi:hypothetical protein
MTRQAEMIVDNLQAMLRSNVGGASHELKSVTAKWLEQQIDKALKLKRPAARLNKLACWHVTEEPLWWQQEHSRNLSTLSQAIQPDRG